MKTLMVRSGRAALAAAGLLAVVASQAAAQNGGPKWQAWIGCWSPVPVTEPGMAPVATTPTNSMIVCITPSANPNIADVATVSGGKVISTEHIDASGTAQPIDAQGCSGTQSASWSGDERRLYLKSASSCQGLKSTTSGILSMSPNGDWLDIRGVSTGDGENVRVSRFKDAGIPSGIPTEIATALTGRDMVMSRARMAAGAPVGQAAVIEASKSADSTVVSAWLLERGQKFALNAKTLLGLADAGVPSNVTDAIVAVSNPRAFAVARADVRNVREDEYTGRRVYVMTDPGFYSPWAWGYSPFYGYSNYGYPYGYGGYYGAGYYGGGYYGGTLTGGYYGGGPIIVVNGNSGAPHGTAVKGKGYGSGGSGSSASSSRSAQGSNDRPSNSNGSSTSASPSTSTAQPSSPPPAQQAAPARTAQPRNP